jgi:hypothetical protein
MAERISVQIALEGGAEIARQLEGIGQTGEKAFDQIAKAAEQVGGFKNLKPEEVTQKLQQMGVTGVDAIRKIQQAVQSAARLETLTQGISSVENAFAALGRAAGPIGAAIAVGFAAAGKAAFEFLNSLNAINAAAAKAGLSVQAYDQLSKALQGAGVSAKGTDQILQTLNQTLAKANVDKVNQAIDDLKQGGISTVRGIGGFEFIPKQFKTLAEAAKGIGPAAAAARKDLVRMGEPIPEDAVKTLQELVAETGDAKAGLVAFVQQLQKMPDGVQRTSFAIQELKDGGLELVDALKTGTIDQFFAKLQQGSQITEQQVIVAARQRQAINQMSAAWEEFKATVIAPVAIPLLQGMIDVIPAIGSALKDLGSAVVSMGQLIASVASSILSGFAPLGAALTSLGEVASSVGSAILSGFAPIGQALTDLGSVAASIGQSFVEGFALVGAAITAAANLVTQFASTVAGFVWGPIEAGIAIWNSITGAIQAAIDKLKEFLNLLPGGAGGPKLGETGGVQVGGAAHGGLVGGRGSGTSDSNLAWLSRGEYVTPARVVRQPGVLGFLEALRRGGGIPGYQEGGAVGGPSTAQKVGSFFQQLVNQLTQVSNQISQANNTYREALVTINASMIQSQNQLADSLQSAIDSISGIIDRLPNALKRLTEGFARGGLLGGRGTGTSDSNLAWVSRGEYITPARAVAQPGVLAFLEALRRSGGNLRAVLDGMGRFALGGLVPRPALAFAGGGLAGGSNVTIQFPGLPPITGLRASAEIVGELQRAAALAQVRSGGRKPSRYS